MRIGDLLLADGVIGSNDLDAALTEQAVTRAGEHAAGGLGPTTRLGSILLRRGLIPADVIARVLARQHNVPAALGRHLEQRDPALAALLPAELALRFVAIPVAQTHRDGGLALIVCMRDPSDPAAIALLARAVRMPVVPAVACEAILAPLVARVYHERAATPVEEMEVDMNDTGPVVTEPLDPMTSGAFQLVDLDDKSVARDETQVAPPTTQRPSGRMNAASVPPPIHAAASVDDNWRITGERTAIPAPAEPPPAPSFDATIARIAATSHRDDIADAVIAFLAGTWSSAVVLLVRDGLALGHRGFGGALTPAAVEAIVVPLNQPSVLRTAHDRKQLFVGAPHESSVVQDRFLRATGYPARGQHELVVIPVSLKDRVVCLVFAHGLVAGHPPDVAHAELTSLAHAMEASFLRLIRESKKLPRLDA